MSGLYECCECGKPIPEGKEYRYQAFAASDDDLIIVGPCCLLKLP